MLMDAAQAAADAGKSSASILLDAGVIGLMITNSFMLLKDWLRTRAERQKARDAADEAEAKALQAQAAALASGKAGQAPGNGQANGHQQYVVPHTAMLERHDAELKALKESSSRVERENREDHQKIFTKLDDLKDLIVERQPGEGG